MKVKVSKVMAKHIAKVLKEHGIRFEEVSVQKMSEGLYRFQFGFNALLDADDYGDYEWGKDEYKVIRIVYPYEDYAMPTYITTKNLVEMCREAKNDIVQFNEKLCDAIAI